MKTLAFFNEENVSEKNIGNLRKHQATRGVIFDHKGLVCLLYSKKHGWYELPGGAIEGTETREAAFLRECKEESGCEVEIVKDLGVTFEVRFKYDLLVETFCYLARVEGEKGNPDMADDEKELGLEVLWFEPTEAASILAKMVESDDLYKRYLKERAEIILSEGIAQNQLLN